MSDPFLAAHYIFGSVQVQMFKYYGTTNIRKEKHAIATVKLTSALTRERREKTLIKLVVTMILNASVKLKAFTSNILCQRSTSGDKAGQLRIVYLH